MLSETAKTSALPTPTIAPSLPGAGGCAPGYRPSFDIGAVVAGAARLSDDQLLELYERAPLTALGRWAHGVALRLHPEDYRTYVIDRNINYTNICTARCTFCAFKRNDKNAPDAYTLSPEAIHRKIAELVAIGGTQILMQGGMNPDLPIAYYENLLRGIREKFPAVHIHAFSPPEFVEFARFFKMPVAEVLRRFKEAGLATVPGGGGEIFAARVRRRIGPGKCTGDQWLEVMSEAHKLGMNTSATMLIGHIEDITDRIDHLHRIRDRQDWALAWHGHPAQVSDGGIEGDNRGEHRRDADATCGEHRRDADATCRGSYTAFIHWTYQPDNTPLDRKRKWNPDSTEPFHFDEGRTVRLADAHEYLRMLALARLYLDNIQNLQSSWVTMGPKIGQLALFFGANDMGSVMMEENVVSSAGTTYRLDEAMICRLIRDAGWIPCQRNQYYEVLQRHDGPSAPDLAPRTPGTFAPRQHRITAEEAAAYKAAGLTGSLPSRSIPLPVAGTPTTRIP